MLMSINRINSKPGPVRGKQKDLIDLMKSIKELGLLNPVTIQRVGEKYKCVAGNRRLKAAKVLGLQQIPVRLIEE